MDKPFFATSSLFGHFLICGKRPSSSTSRNAGGIFVGYILISGKQKNPNLSYYTSHQLLSVGVVLIYEGVEHCIQVAYLYPVNFPYVARSTPTRSPNFRPERCWHFSFLDTSLQTFQLQSQESDRGDHRPFVRSSNFFERVTAMALKRGMESIDRLLNSSGESRHSLLRRFRFGTARRLSLSWALSLTLALITPSDKSTRLGLLCEKCFHLCFGPFLCVDSSCLQLIINRRAILNKISRDTRCN